MLTRDVWRLVADQMVLLADVLRLGKVCSAARKAVSDDYLQERFAKTHPSLVALDRGKNEPRQLLVALFETGLFFAGKKFRADGGPYNDGTCFDLKSFEIGSEWKMTLFVVHEWGYGYDDSYCFSSRVAPVEWRDNEMVLEGELVTRKDGTYTKEQKTDGAARVSVAIGATYREMRVSKPFSFSFVFSKAS